MKTLAVMCIELQSTSPSRTPLLRTASSTCGVMFTNAICDGILSVTYSVWDFIGGQSTAILAANGRNPPCQALSPGPAGESVLQHCIGVVPLLETLCQTRWRAGPVHGGRRQ